MNQFALSDVNIAKKLLCDEGGGSGPWRIPSFVDVEILSNCDARSVVIVLSRPAFMHPSHQQRCEALRAATDRHSSVSASSFPSLLTGGRGSISGAGSVVVTRMEAVFPCRYPEEPVEWRIKVEDEHQDGPGHLATSAAIRMQSGQGETSFRPHVFSQIAQHMQQLNFISSMLTASATGSSQQQQQSSTLTLYQHTFLESVGGLRFPNVAMFYTRWWASLYVDSTNTIGSVQNSNARLSGSPCSSERSTSLHALPVRSCGSGDAEASGGGSATSHHIFAADVFSPPSPPHCDDKSVMSGAQSKAQLSLFRAIFLPDGRILSWNHQKEPSGSQQQQLRRTLSCVVFSAQQGGGLDLSTQRSAGVAGGAQAQGGRRGESLPKSSISAAAGPTDLKDGGGGRPELCHPSSMEGGSGEQYRLLPMRSSTADDFSTLPTKAAFNKIGKVTGENINHLGERGDPAGERGTSPGSSMCLTGVVAALAHRRLLSGSPTGQLFNPMLPSDNFYYGDSEGHLPFGVITHVSLCAPSSSVALRRNADLLRASTSVIPHAERLSSLFLALSQLEKGVGQQQGTSRRLTTSHCYAQGAEDASQFLSLTLPLLATCVRVAAHDLKQPYWAGVAVCAVLLPRLCPPRDEARALGSSSRCLCDSAFLTEQINGSGVMFHCGQSLQCVQCVVTVASVLRLPCLAREASIVEEFLKGCERLANSCARSRGPSTHNTVPSSDCTPLAQGSGQLYHQPRPTPRSATVTPLALPNTAVSASSTAAFRGGIGCSPMSCFPSSPSPQSVEQSFVPHITLSNCCVCNATLSIKENKDVEDAIKAGVASLFPSFPAGATPLRPECAKARFGGLLLQCVKCGHGGHYHHIVEWWERTRGAQCPTGCGCACAY